MHSVLSRTDSAFTVSSLHCLFAIAVSRDQSRDCEEAASSGVGQALFLVTSARLSASDSGLQHTPGWLV
jgi:hypothetical protein